LFFKDGLDYKNCQNLSMNRNKKIVVYSFSNLSGQKKRLKMYMPQKVRHYLGHFLWKEK
jgi:hypothetical protein